VLHFNFLGLAALTGPLLVRFAFPLLTLEAPVALGFVEVNVEPFCASVVSGKHNLAYKLNFYLRTKLIDVRSRVASLGSTTVSSGYSDSAPLGTVCSGELLVVASENLLALIKYVRA
jgi:hypothetical protein